MSRRDSQAENEERKHDGSRMSRRQYLAVTGAAGLVAAAGCTGGGGGDGGGGDGGGGDGGGTPTGDGGSGGSPTTINILTWEEYADSDIKSRIEEALNVKLDITKSTSSSKMFSSWNSGQYKQFDIAIPNNNYIPKMMSAEKNGEPMIAPVDMEVVSNYDEIYEVFKNFADTQFTMDGNVYGVPIRFGWYGYSYDSREISEDHEQSYSMLFNDDYKGKIIMYDNHFKAMSAAALHLGHRDSFEGAKVTLSQKQIDEVKQKMVEQKDLLQGYIAADPTYIKSFKQGNFVIGQSGRNEIVEMWSNGNDWPQMATPKEGSLAWFESAAVSNASDNKKTAWKVVNEYIGAKNGARLAKVGFSPSVNPTTQENLSEEENQMFGSIDPSRLDAMIPFKAVENEEAWIKAWEEIKAA